MSFFSRLFRKPQTAPANVVVQAIQQAEVATNTAQRAIEDLLRQLNAAEAEKVRVLQASQVAIQTALTADVDALEAEKARHQAEMTELENSFRIQRELLEKRMKQLAELNNQTVTAVEGEFNGKVSDAESRAKAAKRELDRIQSQLGNAGQQ